MKKEGCSLRGYNGPRGIRQVERHRDVGKECPEGASDDRPGLARSAYPGSRLGDQSTPRGLRPQREWDMAQSGSAIQLPLGFSTQKRVSLFYHAFF